MKLLLENIKELVQVEDQPVPFRAGKEMAKVNTIKDAFLIIRDEVIEEFGPMEELKDKYIDDDLLIEIDCTNRLVYPSFCDSHTHLVYAAPREKEYVDRIKGLSYEEIARKGGGILNSAKLLHETSEDELYESAMDRVWEIVKMGTGAVEIKSGYGLNTEDELKMLRVIRRIKQTAPICVRANFLGAHAIPLEYKSNPAEYVDIIINEMIPQVAAEELADFIDVFCDQGFFSVEDTERILMAGMKYGLRPKIHANELGLTGGIQAGVKYNALSVDHLEFVGDEEIAALKDSETMPTVLPGAAFFLNMKLSPVREMIEAGLPVALASDFNPGSSPSGNMSLISAMGCINFKMLPEEVINATTLNTAYAMGISESYGSIARDKIANLFITGEIPGIEYLPYAYGSNLVETVIINGEIQNF
ncbi:imidazolonepropionase [Draconibacterium halophilum]|uniref:Imidazolonepropionase n=1 Tax=Draconibacterium halophilum TaxID=2706887 RepID=A0A6C0RCK2_9BACT|nr:imidazolonepropionase [Draconibacterium halophilum]QIA07622.1 imidazolonepropionase [Draconibacterium halophilum]